MMTRFYHASFGGPGVRSRREIASRPKRARSRVETIAARDLSRLVEHLARVRDARVSLRKKGVKHIRHRRCRFQGMASGF